MNASAIRFTVPVRSRVVCAAAQRGAVLFIALIMLVALSLSGVALVRSVDTTVVIAGNMAFRQGALMATDVGVEAASQILKDLVLTNATEANDPDKNYTASYDSATIMPAQLSAGTANPVTDVSNTGNTARYWLERMCLTAGPAQCDTAPRNCVCPESTHLPFYRVTTRVDGPRGTVAITQATIETPGQFIPKHAILAEKKLKMSSTISIGGNGGHVHSNTRVEMSGTTTLTLETGTVSAVGTSTGSSSPNGVYNSGSFSGTITQNAAEIFIPEFNPVDYKQYADFQLRKDGSVVNRLGEILMPAADGQGGKKWLGWKYTPPSGGAANALAEPGSPPTLVNLNRLAKWELLDDNSNSTGLLYVEGHVEVQSSPAAAGSGKGPIPWVVAIMATGHLRMNNTNIQNYTNQPLPWWARRVIPTHAPSGSDFSCQPTCSPVGGLPNPADPWPGAPVPEGVQNLFLVAGTDLKLDGTINQYPLSQPGIAEGLYTSREQFSSSGTVNLKGSILIKDKYNIDPFITETQISGTTTLTYGGSLKTPVVAGSSRRVTWRTIQQ